jgi:hypothetical protein
MQADENRVRYCLRLPQQQRDELNPRMYPFCLHEEDISLALADGIQGGLRFGDSAGQS